MVSGFLGTPPPRTWAWSYPQPGSLHTVSSRQPTPRGVPTGPTKLASSVATSRRVTASRAHRPVPWGVIHSTWEEGRQEDRTEDSEIAAQIECIPARTAGQ